MLRSRTLSRIIGLLLALLLLQGCSTVRIGYNQAPDLLYWWIDGYFDVNEAQTPRLRDELAKLHQWHRSSELPRYASLLQKTQQLAPAEVSGPQVCALYDEVRTLTDRLLARALGPAAELAITLTPAQLEHLQRKFDKNNQEYVRDFQRGNAAERQERRLKTALERSETSYGGMEEAQVSVIRGTVRTSAFDPQLTMLERRRRQQDLLQTLRRLLAENASAAQAKTALSAYVERGWKSPDPAYRTYSERATENACANIALIHNSSTAAQRGKLAQWFNGYESDARSLIPPKP